MVTWMLHATSRSRSIKQPTGNFAPVRCDGRNGYWLPRLGGIFRRNFHFADRYIEAVTAAEILEIDLREPLQISSTPAVLARDRGSSFWAVRRQQAVSNPPASYYNILLIKILFLWTMVIVYNVVGDREGPNISQTHKKRKLHRRDKKLFLSLLCNLWLFSLEFTHFNKIPVKMLRLASPD